jgi:hypothetical protein
VKAVSNPVLPPWPRRASIRSGEANTILGALSTTSSGGDHAREATTRAFRNVVNAVAIEQELETYRARVETGATVADLSAGGERSEPNAT